MQVGRVYFQGGRGVGQGVDQCTRLAKTNMSVIGSVSIDRPAIVITKKVVSEKFPWRVKS
jgi:hypothetical protein